MSVESKIKAEAKARLNNNWVKSITITTLSISLSFIVMLVYELGSLILSIDVVEIISTHKNYRPIIHLLRNFPFNNLFLFVTLSIFTTISIVLLFAPLTLGIKRWYYNLAQGKTQSVLDCCYYFKSTELFSRSICYFFILLFKLIFSLFTLTLPGIVLLVISSIFMQRRDLNLHNICALGIILSGVIMLIGVFLFFIVCLRYFLSSYILVSNDKLFIRDCFKISVKSSKDHIWKILILIFKFIPLLILNFFIIPTLYVNPYFKTSLSVCAKWIILKNETAE